MPMASTSGEHSSAKRKRVEEPDASLPTRDKPYFDDGNIILAVKNSHFRVYRGVLATLSPVFSDMFALPQPTKGEILVDGCPVIQLDDSVEDWRTILSAIFPSFEYIEKFSLPMHVVETYLRLGTKYHMEEFRTQAVKRLSYEFPATLEELDTMDNHSRINACASYADEIFTVINLARSHDLPRVLPWAFTAACGLLSFEDIFRKTGPTQPYLSQEDQQICVVGWRRLLKEQRLTTFAWLKAGCSRLTCKHAMQTILIDELLSSDDPFRKVVPTKPECIALARWQKGWEENLCSSCMVMARASHRRGRQRMWDALPSIFGLPEWAELIKP
ncbi:hypothetical protein PILCRDRAFT_652388 [Piloderma croceum F 1598]|uniref:BTB domain-containing protein n=1 Tax=Piloderma croceum (strain F 1598) TaxID=765440 RepID=A0A0C3BFT4_PILCF|nr:hypothetical protein PILCRDRAFT_652388 [Piloderma croceum F 1598]